MRERKQTLLQGYGSTRRGQWTVNICCAQGERAQASPSGHNSFQTAAEMQRYLVTWFKVNDIVKILGLLRKLLRNIGKTGPRDKYFHLGENDRKMEKYTIRSFVFPMSYCKSDYSTKGNKDGTRSTHKENKNTHIAWYRGEKNVTVQQASAARSTPISSDWMAQHNNLSITVIHKHYKHIKNSGLQNIWHRPPSIHKMENSVIKTSIITITNQKSIYRKTEKTTVLLQC